MLEPEPDNVVLDALDRFNVHDLLEHSEDGGMIVTIEATQPLKKSLKAMHKHGFLSLPVVDGHAHVVGNIDLLDIIRFYADIYSKVSVRRSPPISFRYDHRMEEDMRPLSNESHLSPDPDPHQRTTDDLKRSGGSAYDSEDEDDEVLEAMMQANSSAQQEPPKQKGQERKYIKRRELQQEELRRIPATERYVIGTELEAIIEADWMTSPISVVMKFSRRNPPAFVTRLEPLSKFSRTMTTGRRHRTLVVDDAHVNEPTPSMQHVQAILSQYDVALFIRRMLHWSLTPPDQTVVTPFLQDLFESKILDLKHHLANVAHSKIKDLGLGSTQFEKSIVSVRSKVAMLDALKFIITCEVSILAVIGARGQLLNSLSGTDLRQLSPKDYNALTQPVNKFLKAAGDNAQLPVKIDKQCLLIEALDKIAGPQHNRRIHHLWMCNEHDRADGLLSLTDLMRIATTYHLPMGRTPSSARQIGLLFVSVVLAKGLKQSRNINRKGRNAYVALKYPSQPLVKTPPIPGSLSPSFKNATFSFTVTTSHIGRDLVVSVYDKRSFFKGDKLLGQVGVEISWVANAFGAGTRTDTLHERVEWIPLRLNDVPSQQPLGQILIKISYAPHLE